MGWAAAIVDRQSVEALLTGLRLALGTGSQATDRDVLSRVTDWRTVANLAKAHRVSTLLLRALRSNGIRVPDAVVERALVRRRQRNVARGMRQVEGMRRATAGLAARGIPALTLKGLPLGQRLYGSPFAKSSVDIDLLVPSDAFAAAGRVLHDLGWRRSPPDFRETPARARWSDRVLKEQVFIGPGGKLELHRNLLGNPFLFDPPFAELDAGGATIEVAGCPFRTLGDAHQVLYLACHGSLHGWERLKWLCDFAMLVRSMEDGAVERAVARGLTQGLAGAVVPALRLSLNALHVEAPLAAAQRDDDWRIRLVVGVSRRTWTPRRGWRRLVQKATIRAGRLVVGRGVRYSLQDMRRLLILPQDFGRVDLPDWLFWLYVPLRPLLWMLRALRGRRRARRVRQ